MKLIPQKLVFAFLRANDGNCVPSLDDPELYKFKFSDTFTGFRRYRTAERMKIDQYCQRQHCKQL